MMEAKIRPHAGVISKVVTMADNSVRVQVDCQEMPPEDMSEIFGQKGKLGYFVFAEVPPKEIDLKDAPEITIDRGEKTPSQRLRAVLYRIWEQSQTDLDWEVWYRSKMDSIIEQLKEKIN